jgi:hypothetical protein
MCESEQSQRLIYAQKSPFSTKYKNLMNFELNFNEILKSAQHNLAKSFVVLWY